MSASPIHIISLGAGVQSSTMSLMAACGEITPMPVAAVFADTQGEPEAVYRWLNWLETQLQFPIVRVSKGSLSKRCLTVYHSRKGKLTFMGIPAFTQNPDGTTGIMSRQCTRDFKIDPVDKVITALMRQHKTRTAIKWMGISLDELSRVKDSRRSTVTCRYPLIDARMHRHDCLRWMAAKKFPEPPRSACIYCPYRSNDEWRRLSPADFAAAVQFEKDYQAAVVGGTLVATPWLHRSMRPLAEVDLSTEEERGQLSMFNNECEGMCGV